MSVVAFAAGFRRFGARHGLAVAGAVVLLAGLSMNRLFAGRLLDALGSNVSVAGVLAVGMTVYAACRCLWHWRCRVLLRLGCTLAFVSVYELNVVVSYMPPSHAWNAVAALSWPAIPFAYAAWGAAALAIAGLAQGTPIGWASEWSVYGLTGRLFAGRHLPRPAHLWLWLPAIVFSALSLVPGLVYSGMAVPGVTWHGQPYEPHLTYALISAWGIITLGVSAAVIGGGWQQQQSGLSVSDRLLVRGGVRMSLYAVVCALVLAAGTASGFWPEPVIDLVIALFTVVYVSVLTASDRGRDRDLVQLSVRNLVVSFGVVTISAFVAFATTKSPALRALEDAGFTIALTFLILTVIHIVNIRSDHDDDVDAMTNSTRGLARFTASEQEHLLALLAVTSKHTLRLYVTSLPFRGVAAVEPRGVHLDELAGLNAFRTALTDVLGVPAAARLLRLLYETSRTRPGRPDGRRPLDPPPMMVARVQFNRRADVTDDPGELTELATEDLKITLFAKSVPAAGDHRGVLRYKTDIAGMNNHELIAMIEKLKGRQGGRPKQALRGLLEDALEELRETILSAPRSSQ